MNPTESLLARIQGEYREMPGLCLTLGQAARLWQIEIEECKHILETLIAQHILWRTPSGRFVSLPLRAGVHPLQAAADGSRLRQSA